MREALTHFDSGHFKVKKRGYKKRGRKAKTIWKGEIYRIGRLTWPQSSYELYIQALLSAIEELKKLEFIDQCRPWTIKR